jgi:hypothetical protein
MSYKIVVARYNENIHWLKHDKNVIIYNKNKNNKLNLPNEIILENVGRESETYLNYIINNYHKLPDIVVFTQARIADHRGRDDINYLLYMKNQAYLHGKSYPIIVHTKTNNKSCWDNDWNLNNDGSYYLQNCYLNNKPIIFEDWFKKHILFNKDNYPKPFCVYTNGLFAVKKELILRHPIEYYKYLIGLVNHHIDPAEGHFFERSWFYIFS